MNSRRGKYRNDPQLKFRFAVVVVVAWKMRWKKKKRKKRKKRKRKGRGERSVRENEASGGTSLYFKHEVAPVVHVHSGVLRVHVLRCSTVRLPSGRPVIDRAIYLAEFSIFRKLEKTIPRIVLFLQYANFTLEFTIQRFYSSAAF